MIHRIALTGGPCGGKSTALPRLAKHFRDRGFNVYTTPEMATLFFDHGVKLNVEPPAYHKALEVAAFNVQLEMEEGFTALARSGAHSRDTVLIHDRGLTDLAAYCSPEMWEDIVTTRGFTVESVKRRYDVVLHFQTAAIGAPAFFTNENNPARQCTLEVAETLDGRSFNAWNGHPNRKLLDNSSDFEGKLTRAISSIEDHLRR